MIFVSEGNLDSLKYIGDDVNVTRMALCFASAMCYIYICSDTLFYRYMIFVYACRPEWCSCSRVQAVFHLVLSALDKLSKPAELIDGFAQHEQHFRALEASSNL